MNALEQSIYPVALLSRNASVMYSKILGPSIDCGAKRKRVGTHHAADEREQEGSQLVQDYPVWLSALMPWTEIKRQQEMVNISVPVAFWTC